MPTKVTVRALCCDAKVIGSLVGGCRVTLRHRDSGEELARGHHLGGSGSTEAIMKRPKERGSTILDAPGTAAFVAEINLAAPTPVEILVEGPLAFPHAMQKALLSTWLIPGRHVTGDGFILELHGFIVEIIEPSGADVLRSDRHVHLQAGVRLL